LAFTKEESTAEKEVYVMTKHLRGVMLASAVALMWCLGTPTASADDWNRKTVLTIDQALVVPGATLLPGTYTFILGNPETSRDVVLILREDGTPVTSAHTKRISRNNENRDLALFVALNESGGMPVMRGWFYPGDRDGYQFVYPTDQARSITRLESVEIPVAPRG
jgi:hypothetical protein